MHMKLLKKTAASGRERRLDQRKPTVQQAVIWGDHNQSRQCCITSVSLTGLFLELSDAHLTNGTDVQVFFYSDMDGAQKLCSEWVRVVGERNNGVAVTFIRFDNEHQCNIQLMLHKALTGPATPLQPQPGSNANNRLNFESSARQAVH